MQIGDVSYAWTSARGRVAMRKKSTGTGGSPWQLLYTPYSGIIPASYKLLPVYEFHWDNFRVAPSETNRLKNDTLIHIKLPFFS